MKISTINVAAAMRATALTAAGVMLLILLFSPIAGAAPITVGGPSDCDEIAIIRCGAHSTQELRNKYNNDTFVQKVYSDFGITKNDMNNLAETNVAGHVTKDGKVFVNNKDKAVATNAMTAGRQGNSYDKHPPSASFQQASLPAFVAMKNGKFQYAVIASCGNPVMATATYTPAPPSPAPTTPKPTPKPQKPAPTPAATTQSQGQAQAQVQNNVQTQEVNVTTTAATPAPVPSPVYVPTPVPVEAETVATGKGELVDTGAAGVITAFVAASSLGFLGYRQYLSRRYNA